ncbi:MAG TPA: HAD-IC family P-type ATPase, partial [Candidatus Saccharimonadales bacterium]|nr:HAD-IC family P-type ATPase [Candidatus Saccharimonadales bacterium]
TSLATMSTISKEDLKNNLAKELTDPTETAMAVVAAKAGFYAFAREKRYPELLEIPFDQELRLSTSIHRLGRVNRYIVKGSPEKIIGLSKNILTVGGSGRRLLKDSKEKLLAQANDYASQGYRVTVLGYVDYPERVPLKATMVRGLTLAGFLIMADPIRPEVRAAIEKTAQAGIRTVMITGDHLLTAQAIGEQVGLLNYGTAIHADEVTKRQLGEVSVIARATPKEKLIIVEQLQKQGQVVAMTGDGVNDAPALKRADVGIAMGEHGSDVAVEAADMVLLNDNFTSIVGAIEQGRLIWENLRKAALYLISTALAEVLIIVIALLAGWPLPLLAAQILWLNLVTEGLNSMSLTIEPPESDLMARPPRPDNEPIIDGAMLMRFVLHSLVMTAISLLVFHVTLDSGVGYARTMVVLTMIFFHFYNLLNCRSQTKSIFAMNYRTNRLLIGMLLLSVVLAIGAVYEPHLQALLHTTALNLGDLLWAIILPASIIIVDEFYKLALRSAQAWAKAQRAFV